MSRFRTQSNGPQSWVGGRAEAWRYLMALWGVGMAAGVHMGYGELLVEQLSSPPTLGVREARWLAIAAIGGTIFLKAAFIWGSRRFGRPLSLFSLLVFPLCNAVGEGFALLLAFDLGRWVLVPLAGPTGPAQLWQPGTSAIKVHGINGDLIFKEFALGFGPFILLFTVLYSFVWEERILPVHLDLDAPNKFIKPMIMCQFFYIAIYYVTGDVATYVAFRYIYDLLTVVAVRLQPPYGKVEEVPDEYGAAQAVAAAAKKKQEGKKEN